MVRFFSLFLFFWFIAGIGVAPFFMTSRLRAHTSTPPLWRFIRTVSFFPPLLFFYASTRAPRGGGARKRKWFPFFLPYFFSMDERDTSRSAQSTQKIHNVFNDFVLFCYLQCQCLGIRTFFAYFCVFWAFLLMPKAFGTKGDTLPARGCLSFPSRCQHRLALFSSSALCYAPAACKKEENKRTAQRKILLFLFGQKKGTRKKKATHAAVSSLGGVGSWGARPPTRTNDTARVRTVPCSRCWATLPVTASKRRLRNSTSSNRSSAASAE